MTKYIGFDVHVKETVACIHEDATDSYAYETVGTSAVALKRLIRRHSEGGPVQAAMEVGPLSGFLYDELRGDVGKLVVCNSSAIPWMWRSDKKTDRVDARKMAVLLKLGHLPAVHMPKKEVRLWRKFIQSRRRMVEARTRAKNRVRGMINSLLLRRQKVGAWWTKKNMNWLKSLAAGEPGANLPKGEAWLLEGMIEEIEFYDERIKAISGHLDQIAAKNAGVQLLMTIRGVGPRTAEAVVAYADKIARFAKSANFSSYFGFAPRLDESADRRHRGHISKRGPSVVRWLLVEAAWRAIAHNKALREFYLRVLRGRPERKKIAIVALARKMLTIMFAMLRTGEVFNPALVAGQIGKREAGAKTPNSR